MICQLNEIEIILRLAQTFSDDDGSNKFSYLRVLDVYLSRMKSRFPKFAQVVCLLK